MFVRFEVEKTIYKKMFNFIFQLDFSCNFVFKCFRLKFVKEKNDLK